MSKHNAEPRSENEKNPSQGTDWLGFYTANAKPPRRKTIFLIKAQPSHNQKTPRELERRSVFS